jgi:WD40 repeat protein
MEKYEIINVAHDSSEINHLTFYSENSELLFAASNEHIKLWNVESNKLLDCMSLPPKTITDMKISPESGDHGLLLVSAIHKESVNIYF